MPAVESIGHGSQFELGNGDGPPETFTTVLGVQNISFGSNKVDTPDNTAMDTTGNTRTYIPGLENPGDVTIKAKVIPGDLTQAKLYTYKGVIHNMKVVLPGAAETRAFQGIISSVDIDIPDDKQPTYSVKVQISGPVVKS